MFFSLAATLLKELILLITRKFCNHVPSNKEMFRKYSCDFKKEQCVLKLFRLEALLRSGYMTPSPWTTHMDYPKMDYAAEV